MNAMGKRNEITKMGLEMDLWSKQRYSREFLRIAGLKVGDRVQCKFAHSTGTQRTTYAVSTVTEGVIKQGGDRVAYVESTKGLSFNEMHETPTGGVFFELLEKRAIAPLDSIILDDDE